MLGIIYKATNLKNGKSYIGQTIRTLGQRISAHKYETNNNSKFYFHNALRKYGFDNFKWDILEKCESNLDIAEQWYIRKFDTYKNGYNMTFGGDFNPSQIPEIAKKISESNKGRIHSLETRKKMSESLKGKIPWNKEISHSEETKEKIRNNAKNNPNFGMKNKKHTKESKQKIRENHADQSGDKNGFFGKKHTKESKQKMSINTNVECDNNPMYGKKHTKESIDKNKWNNSKNLWFVETPNKQGIWLFNLSEFCRINKLNRGNITYSTTKGYGATKLC